MKRTAAVVALLAASLSASCAPSRGDRFTLAFARGQRAYQAGRYAEASQAFGEASAHSLRVKDRDEALLLEARAYQRQNRFPEAKAALTKLAQAKPQGPRSVRALFDVADLEIEHGDKAAGYVLLDRAAREHPEHGLARPAIARLVRHAEDQGGAGAALAWFRAHEAAFKNTEQAQVIEYGIATELFRTGQKRAAHDAFMATAKAHPYPRGGLTDDALFHAAELDFGEGKHDEAIAHLRLMLATREKSDTMGSYERPRYSEAQMKIGEIYRDGLRDHASARREFHKLYTDFKTSIRRDDALWAEARLAKTDGDSSSACDAADRIASEFPTSRYAGCVKEVCASATSKAKRPCADYILRDLAPNAKSD